MRMLDDGPQGYFFEDFEIGATMVTRDNMQTGEVASLLAPELSKYLQ